MDNRRVANPDDKKYQIDEMWAHQEEICRLVVASNGGFTNEYIAKQVGCTAQTVSNVRNSIVGRMKIDELSKKRDENAIDLAEKVKEIAPAALELMSNTITAANDDLVEGSPDPKLLGHGLRAAGDIIDHSVPRRIEEAHIHGHITYEQIMEMRKRIEEKRVSNASHVSVEDIQNATG